MKRYLLWLMVLILISTVSAKIPLDIQATLQTDTPQICEPTYDTRGDTHIRYCNDQGTCLTCMQSEGGYKLLGFRDWKFRGNLGEEYVNTWNWGHCEGNEMVTPTCDGREVRTQCNYGCAEFIYPFCMNQVVNPPKLSYEDANSFCDGTQPQEEVGFVPPREEPSIPEFGIVGMLMIIATIAIYLMKR